MVSSRDIHDHLQSLGSVQRLRPSNDFLRVSASNTRNTLNDSTRLGKRMKILPILILAAELDMVDVKHLLHLGECCQLRS